jgi:hypothetical protein
VQSVTGLGRRNAGECTAICMVIVKRLLSYGKCDRKIDTTSEERMQVGLDTGKNVETFEENEFVEHENFN